MDARTLAFYSSMRRIADVVDHHPTLRARAAESKAFELFKAVIAQFDALAVEEASNRAKLRELNARFHALRREVHDALHSIQATAALIPNHVVPLPTMSPPSLSLHLLRYSYLASAQVNLAAAREAAFVDAGLNPRTFDDARRAIAELIDAHLHRAMAQVHVDAWPTHLDLVVDSARKHLRQLYFELKPCLIADASADWKRASSLGRSHRAKTLGPAKMPPRLSAGTRNDAPATDPDSPASGIRGFARKVVLRIVGGVEPANVAAPTPDAQIEEIRRLPSSVNPPVDPERDARNVS